MISSIIIYFLYVCSSYSRDIYLNSSWSGVSDGTQQSPYVSFTEIFITSDINENLTIYLAYSTNTYELNADLSINNSSVVFKRSFYKK